MFVRIHIEAAILGVIDYKRTFAKTYASDEERLEAYSQCHLRSANRVLRALLANGGASAFNSLEIFLNTTCFKVYS